MTIFSIIRWCFVDEKTGVVESWKSKKQADERRHELQKREHEGRYFFMVEKNTLNE